MVKAVSLSVGPPTSDETAVNACAERLAASTGHTDALRPPKMRSTKEGFGGHWQRLDFGTPAIT